jgi:type IV pilus assembly protein PilA
MRKLKAGFTLIELMIVVAIIGLLAALAIPNFLKFQARSKQSEARSNLKAVFTAQKSYYGDKQMYLDLSSVIGFEPEFNNRYTYSVGPAGNTEARTVIGAPVMTSGASLSCPALSGISVVTCDQVKWGTTCYVAQPATVVGTPNAGGSVVPMAAVGVLPVALLAACCPNGICEFKAGANGNIDNDTEFDTWSISSQPSIAQATTCIGPTGASLADQAAEGEPVNECNDVNL